MQVLYLLYDLSVLFKPPFIYTAHMIELIL